MKRERSSSIRAIHQARGRARLSVSGLYRSSAVAEHLHQVLTRSMGITRASTNPVTGNLLVLFTEPHSIATVVSLVHGAVRGVESLHPHGSFQGTPGPLGPFPVETEEKVEEPLVAGEEERAYRHLDETLRPWHSLEPTQAAQFFGTSLESGLNPAAVRSRQLEYGLNALPGMAARSFFAIAKAQVISLPVLLIGATAGLSVATGKMAGGLPALGVALVNAAVGCLPEYQAERSLALEKGAVQLQAEVLREGELRTVPFEIRLAVEAGFDPVALRSRYPLSDIAHRTEEDHFMVTTHRWTEHATLMAVKGSPMEVLERCSHICCGGAVVGLAQVS